MPIPPAQSTTAASVNLEFMAQTGPELPHQTATSFQTLSNPLNTAKQSASSTLLPLGLDAVQFSFALAGGVGSQIVTFISLPQRNNSQNPLNAIGSQSQQPFTVSAKDHLLFTAALQNVVAPNGTVLSVSPFAIDRNNLRIPGPFLGANTFLTFQATVSANSATATGTVSGFLVGTLMLSVG